MEKKGWHPPAWGVLFGMDFTIVTPSFGQITHLGCCIASVADQKDVSLEHIVQDNETPGFAEFSKKIKQKWPDRSNYRLTMKSEPDQGMYQAINRGLKKGTGQFCAYLNCDEQYLPGALGRVKEAFQKSPKVEILYGGFLVVDETAKLITAQKPVLMSWRHLATSHLPNFSCGTFFRRSMLEHDQAYFDPSLRFCGDLEWNLSRLQKKTPSHRLSSFTSVFLEHSLNAGVSLAGLREAAAIQRKVSSPSVRSLRWLWRIGHWTRKFAEGQYFPQKIGCSIYRSGFEPHRKTIPSTWVSPLWRSRIRLKTPQH